MDKLECKAVRPWFSCRPVLHAPAPTRQQPALPKQPSYAAHSQHLSAYLHAPCRTTSTSLSCPASSSPFPWPPTALPH